MPRNRLPRVMKHYSPTGRRKHGRRLKRLLDTWDRNGSTSGPTPWQIYDYYYYYYYYYDLKIRCTTTSLRWRAYLLTVYVLLAIMRIRCVANCGGFFFTSSWIIAVWFSVCVFVALLIFVSIKRQGVHT